MALALALPIAFGAPWAPVAALGLALARPWWAAVLFGAWAAVPLLGRDDDSLDLEARLVDALAAELRSGAAWRGALEAAAARVPALPLGAAAARCRAGLAADDVAPPLVHALPHLGRRAAAALRLVATGGGPAAAVFAALAGQAAQHAADARERAAATAQARLSAALVGGAPAVLAGVLLASGRAEAALAAGIGGAVMLGLGAILVVAGAALVFVMLRAAAQ